jgi:hypothetical protein
MKSVKLIMDIIIHIVFLKLFIFIVKLKLEDIDKQKNKSRIKFVINWISTLFIFSFLTSIGAFIMAIVLFVY